MLLAQLFSYGVFGMMIEVFFTICRSLYKRNWRLTGETHGYALFMYGTAGIVFDTLHNLLHWHPILMGLVYTPLIYLQEFGWGWGLKKLTGRCPWDYGLSRWSPAGLINFRYLPFWFILACLFDPVISVLIIKFQQLLVFK
jgi:hypothetical protein